MPMSVSAIRQRVATAISTVMGGAGWRETTGTWDTFGQGDGENRLHKGYAIGVPSTTPERDRQRTAEGAQSVTDLRVRWAYNLAALDQVTSFDAALDAEEDIIAAVVTVRQANDLHLFLQSCSRSVDDQGWVIGDLVWTAHHHLPLV